MARLLLSCPRVPSCPLAAPGAFGEESISRFRFAVATTLSACSIASWLQEAARDWVFFVDFFAAFAALPVVPGSVTAAEALGLTVSSNVGGVVTALLRGLRRRSALWRTVKTFSRHSGDGLRCGLRLILIHEQVVHWWGRRTRCNRRVRADIVVLHVPKLMTTFTFGHDKVLSHVPRPSAMEAGRKAPSHGHDGPATEELQLVQKAQETRSTV